MDRSPKRSRINRQSGVAAIEFALIISVFFVLLSAILGYGAMFWMQQNLAQFAGEGARSVLYARQAPDGLTADLSVIGCRDARAWNADLQCSSVVAPCAAIYGAGTQCVTVALSYPVAKWAPAAALHALVSSFPFFDSSGWVPERLFADAAVQIR